MEGARIPVDSEVLAELARRLRSPDQSFNDLLRDWLGLPPRRRREFARTGSAGATMATPETLEAPSAADAAGIRESEESSESRDEAVPLPEGTALRGRYRGREVHGRIEGGAVVLEGRRFPSLSAAARSVTGHPTNGWRFFEARLPGRGDWLPASRLRPVRTGARRGPSRPPR